MRLIKNSICLFLLVVIANATVGKSVHHIFFHHHEDFHCEAVNESHYHEKEFSHLDFICDFQFSSFTYHKVFSSVNYFPSLNYKRGIVSSISLFNNSSFLFNLRGPPLF